MRISEPIPVPDPVDPANPVLPDGSGFLGDVNFGRITQTRLNSERQVQLAARLTF